MEKVHRSTLPHYLSELPQEAMVELLAQETRIQVEAKKKHKMALGMSEAIRKVNHMKRLAILVEKLDALKKKLEKQYYRLQAELFAK